MGKSVTCFLAGLSSLFGATLSDIGTGQLTPIPGQFFLFIDTNCCLIAVSVSAFL